VPEQVKLAKVESDMGADPLLRAAVAAIPERFRGVARWLALFREGAFDQTLGIVLDLEPEDLDALCQALEDAGLVHREVAWLRFRGGLTEVLREELEATTTEAERAAMRERVVAAYVDLARFLDELQAGGQTEPAGFLAVRELPNLRAAAEHLLAAAAHDPPRAAQAAELTRHIQSLRDSILGPRPPAEILADDVAAARARGAATAALAQLEEVAHHPQAPDWLRRVAPAFAAVLHGNVAAARAQLALLPAEEAAAVARLLPADDAPAE
jgi:hypothetical protein